MGELLDLGSSSKGVMISYAQTLSLFGSEFELLLRTPVQDIARRSPLLAEAVKRVRDGKVIRQPGYDGKFGVIKAFGPGEIDRKERAKSIFTG